MKCQGTVLPPSLPGEGVAKEAPGPSWEPHVAVGCDRQIPPLPRRGRDTYCSEE